MEEWHLRCVPTSYRIQNALAHWRVWGAENSIKKSKAKKDSMQQAPLGQTKARLCAGRKLPILVVLIAHKEWYMPY